MMPGMVSCLTIPSSGKATPWDMQVYNSHPDLSWVIPIYETYTGISRVILTCPGCRFSRCWPGRQAGLDWAREPPTDPGRRSEWARGAGVPEGPQSCSYAVISPAESGRRRGRSGWRSPAAMLSAGHTAACKEGRPSITQFNVPSRRSAAPIQVRPDVLPDGDPSGGRGIAASGHNAPRVTSRAAMDGAAAAACPARKRRSE